MSEFTPLVYGATGWVGGKLLSILKEESVKPAIGTGRLEDRASLIKDLDEHNPSHVLLAAGIIGKPNVDWCETHRTETILGNVVGTLTLVALCHERNIHVTYFGTGCVYTYNDLCPEPPMDPPADPKDNVRAVLETDTPNFRASYYSRTKAMVEELLEPYDNVLTLRVRMPIVQDLLNPRNFVTKVVSYSKVVNVPNSMTVFPELLPLAVDMARKGVTGKVNFTNPGYMSHNQVLELYREYIDPNFTWSNFSLEEQDRVIMAPRSNTWLDTSRLQSMYPDVMPLRDSLIKHVFEPAAKDKEHIARTLAATR